MRTCKEETRTPSEARHVEFFVAGRPYPKGSWRTVPNRRTGKTAFLPSSKGVRAWQEYVQLAAILAWSFRTSDRWFGASLQFFMERHESHYGEDGELKGDAPRFPKVPDGDKLERAVWDAMEGIVYLNDGQIVIHSVSKCYVDRYPGSGPREGVTVRIWELDS